MAAPAVERRAWVRYASSLAADCRPSQAMKEAGWTGTVINISAGGIGLLLRHRFRRGTSLTVDLKDMNGRVVQTVTVQVRHTTAGAGRHAGCWLLGCELTQPLTPAELAALLSPREQNC